MVAMMKLSGKLRWLTTVSINFYHLNFHGCHSVDPSMRLPNKCLIMIMIIIIISNANRTEWSPIRSVIARVINKICGRPICLIMSMITDRIGQHEVLLPINHNFNKICDIIGYFLNQNTRNSKFCFASSEKKSHLSVRVMAHTVQLLRHDTYCPIKLSN